MIWLIHFLVVNIFLLVSVISKRKNFFIYGMLIYSIFTFGQRWMTGEDFPGYLLYYLINFQGPEIGYFALQYFFISNNFYFGILIFLIYSITIINVFYFIKKINKNVVLLIYLFMFVEMYFMQMSQIRQFVAVSFFINAYYFLFNKKYFKFLISYSLAASFHFSVLLLLPFLFIKIKLKRRTLFYALLVFCILPFINIKFIIDIFNINFYSNYLDSAYDTGLSIFHYIKYYIILGIAILYMYNIEKNKLDKMDSMIINGFMLYILFYGLSFQYAPVMRMSYYFKIFELVYLTYYISSLKYFAEYFVKRLVVIVILIFYVSIAVLDPYNITRYEIRFLQLYEDKTTDELKYEIEKFYWE